ncbi:DUF4192 domain-containing protein [Streptomyces telluris]|uniref:DUF4192 domain-containing protein n=1 Tax=Streptomyces telluris TaxID=2720021 RepID=A0A9X2LK09_9ACTN|nr:DUF4192 domain-containing protein [Streptomyces telluris]MCQ8772652.1 DUF4192 domain-containing protein [Streptomyces telluris]NJP78676.1 DUF4192 domain-containing protein [Streptomyces telluris]
MTQHNESARPSTPSSPSAAVPGTAGDPGQQVTLRSPAELADALPYLLGFHPTDSIVLVALHGDRGRFGGRLRLGIPRSGEEWPDVCDQLAETLLTGSSKRGNRPDGVVIFLCQDPDTAAGQSPRQVMERLRPLAQSLRRACGRLDMPVHEALCISDGRFWSYCCPDPRCCPPDGTPLSLPGTSVMAAAATYAGIEVRGTLREMEDRYAPLTGDRAERQRTALDAAAFAMVPRILGEEGCEPVRQETLALARALADRLQAAPPLSGRPASDACDDSLLTDEEAATVIVGLQDRVARDHAAEWMEGPQAPAVLRLWRALARRCVPPYAEYAAAPVALAGWVAWATDDQPEARVALSRALGADPEYVFAQLLYRACNEGLDPEPLRRCLRHEKADRALQDAVRAEVERIEAAATAAGAEGTGATRTVRRRTRPGGPGGGTGPAGSAGSGGPAGRPRARRRSTRKRDHSHEDRSQ